MILLKPMLHEFQHGDLLWADPAIASANLSDITSIGNARYKQYIDKAYKGAMEKDDNEEAMVWMALVSYLKQGSDNGAKQLTPVMLNDLQKLKKKFPAMLDPGLKSTDLVYRGMTLPLARMQELLADVNTELRNVARGYSMEVNTTVLTRADSFTSLTTNRDVAIEFALGRTPAGRWPVVVTIPYQKIANRTLMNPEFLTLIGGHDEAEIWLMDNALPVTSIWMQSPWYRGAVNTPMANAMKAAFADRRVIW